MRMFLDRGFDSTTIVDIAAQCGISKTSFFRYFDSKNDIVWGAFDAHLIRLAEGLRSRPREEAVMTAVLRGITATFSADVDQGGLWLHRFRLQEAEEQRAAQALHWRQWASVVTDFVRERSRADEHDVAPAAIGSAVQGALHAFIQTRDVELHHDAPAVLADFEVEVGHIVQSMQAWLDAPA